MSRRVIAAIALFVACGGERSETKTDLFAAMPTGPALTVSSNLGPVRAELRLRPTEPRLGDILFLELEVSSPANVEAEMPEFGEALGRFSIVDHDWRESRTSSGDLTRTQIYQLQAMTSGRVRIPQVRVEVIDRRADAEASGETRELLLDEIAITVAPIDLATGETTLRSGVASLDIAPIRPWHLWWVWLIAGFVLLAILVALVLTWLGRRRAAARVSAYDLALERLATLQSSGLPAEDELDAWYVELSSIVRHYLEDRFAVRAPELTTEEFLREASQAPELSAQHRDTLGVFLVGCDRVKFAGHRPDASEQGAAITGALRFVKETRPPALEVGGER